MALRREGGTLIRIRPFLYRWIQSWLQLGAGLALWGPIWHFLSSSCSVWLLCGVSVWRMLAESLLLHYLMGNVHWVVSWSVLTNVRSWLSKCVSDGNIFWRTYPAFSLPIQMGLILVDRQAKVYDFHAVWLNGPSPKRRSKLGASVADNAVHFPTDMK
jgi:hypothetical protein